MFDVVIVRCIKTFIRKMATKQDLNILYINIRSIRNKLDELESIVLNYPETIHIIVLTETWIYTNEQQYFNLKEYSAIHDCRDTRGEERPFI